MAIYEYRCKKCNAQFELMRPISDFDRPVTCSRCGGGAERLPSVFASSEGYGLRIPAKEALRREREAA